MLNNLTIVEPLKHYEVLASILRALAGENLKIQVFTTDFCKSQLPKYSANIEIFTEDVQELSDQFLDGHISLINDSDYVLFSTINFRSDFLFRLNANTKVIGLIHNSHNSFLPKEAPVLHPIQHFVRGLLGEYRFSSEVLERLNRVVLPHSDIKKYVQSKNIREKDKILSVEIAVPKYPPIVFDRSIVRIIIPGTVIQSRRDYAQLIKILPELDSKINQSVRLILLGKLNGAEELKIIEKLKKLRLRSIELKYFKDYVPLELYLKHMQEADFLLLPIQRFIRYKALQEERGKTCVSGNINDMVQFGLPAILPAFYPLSITLESLTERYNAEEDLINILTRWINTRLFNIIKSSIRKDLERYEKEVKTNWKQVFQS